MPYRAAAVPDHAVVLVPAPTADPAESAAATAPTISVPAAVLLGTGVTAATTLAGIVAAQATFPMHVYEGATALLAAVTALTGTGVIICVTAARVMRRLDHLDGKVSAQRVIHLPQQSKGEGARHLAAVDGQADKEESRTGLDPETIAAARALARRIVDGPVEVQRDAE